MAGFINNEQEYENTEAQSLPWLIFTLSNNAYAVNSKYVSGILMPPEVTPLPEASDIYKGLVDIRGEVFPLLEVRKLFRFKTIEEECSEFDVKMETVKQAHINWVKELKRCAAENAVFTLTTDHTKCAFGMWYYDFVEHTKNDGALNMLRKAEEPHKLLHKSGITIMDLAKNNADGNNTEKINELMNISEMNYIPFILACIDDAKTVFRNFYRETVVTLSDGHESLGLLVDEVLAIDKVDIICDDRSMNKIVDSRYFTGVGHNEKIKKEILIIDEEMLLRKAKI